jgi:hypothetical protein
MSIRLSRRPTPASVIACIALCLAIVGSAAAGTDTLSHKLDAKEKKQVKKIAKKQVKALAPGLSVANAQTLAGKSAGEFAGAVSEPWHEVGAPGEPALENGYNEFPDAPVGFYKDPLGIVHLKGVLNAAASNVTAFTLPAGYRPGQVLRLPGVFSHAAVSGDEIASIVRIRPDGVIEPECFPACTPVGLDGISFRAE